MKIFGKNVVKIKKVVSFWPILLICCFFIATIRAVEFYVFFEVELIIKTTAIF